MAKVWIKLLTAKSVPDDTGKLQSKNAGDWAEVGKALARKWLADGSATIPRGVENRGPGELPATALDDLDHTPAADDDVAGEPPAVALHGNDGAAADQEISRLTHALRCSQRDG